MPLRLLLPLLPLGFAAVLGYLTLEHVDLSPRVDAKFFFTSDSPARLEASELDRRFEGQELLIVTAHTDDIRSPAYRRRISSLAAQLVRLDDVMGVRSLVNGPKDMEDAQQSPLWSRLLFLEGVEATNLILVVDAAAPRHLVEDVSRVMREHERPDFRLQLAGVPYVLDSIGRHLKRDFAVFSAAAVAVFAVVIVVLFRSWAVLLGSLTACAVAALGTLLAHHLLGQKLGLLTANLVTIAFVLTQSHVAFLTGNWRNLRLRERRPAAAVWWAWRRTIGASGWCMVAALLGFASLLYVEAQPLRELGHGGTIATLCALAAAYLVYPPFLLWAARPGEPRRATERPVPSARVAGTVLLVALALGVGAARVNTDPSLLDYFGRDSEVRRSLEGIDPYGGSSPLSIAVRRADGLRLDNNDSYTRLWRLQRALQNDPAVGTIVSLPVLMAEADRSWLSSLLTWDWLLDLLSLRQFDRVANGFITPDRREGLFMLRMLETGREERRTRIVGRLQDTVRQHGFEPTALGGIYVLQGRLADLVTRSLLEGLVGLLAACGVIAFIVTRSLRAGLIMLLCTAAVPAVALGLFGLLSIPLDIIAAPAINVAIGVAVDSMIHFGTAWRLARARMPPIEAVREARREQRTGIVAFSVIVIAGFAIFAASSFPPTQRFGLAVVLGSAVAGVMTLWILPGLLALVGAGRQRPARCASLAPHP